MDYLHTQYQDIMVIEPFRARVVFGQIFLGGGKTKFFDPQQKGLQGREFAAPPPPCSEGLSPLIN